MARLHKEPKTPVPTLPLGSPAVDAPTVPAVSPTGQTSHPNPGADVRTEKPFKTIQSGSPNLQMVNLNLTEVENLAQIHTATEPESP